MSSLKQKVIQFCRGRCIEIGCGPVTPDDPEDTIYRFAVDVQIAGRMEMIENMLAPPIYGKDANGEEVVIGYGEPIITKEQALELMNAAAKPPMNSSSQ